MKSNLDMLNINERRFARDITLSKFDCLLNVIVFTVIIVYYLDFLLFKIFIICYPYFQLLILVYYYGDLKVLLMYL